jgi:hypothetical protein
VPTRQLKKKSRAFFYRDASGEAEAQILWVKALPQVTSDLCLVLSKVSKTFHLVRFGEQGAL